MKSHMIFSMAVLLGSSPSFANDSTVGFDNYGIIFKKTEDIEMRSEHLYISPSKIDVRYEFFNKTTEPITTVVAFPLPEISAGYEYDVDYPEDDFRTTIDGQIIDTELEEKALLDGKDISDLLKKTGVPLDPTKFEASKIGPSILKELESKQILTCYSYNCAPHWSYKRTYYRTQTFPPQTITRVHHQYTPSKSSAIAGVTTDYSGFPCNDKFSKWLADYTARNGAITNHVSYILTTGGNWAGNTIGDFTLVLDKESENGFVDFCGEGIKKIGPTQFEMRKQNFVPKHDLSVVFVYRWN